MKFKVEYIFSSKHVYIIARNLEGSDFQLSEHATLGGIPIQKWLDQPRKLKDDGTPDLDVYAFVLKNKADHVQFHLEQIVELCE